MKTILAAALALILGLFIGGLPLRSELRKTKAELAAAKEEAAQGGAPTSLPLLGIGSILAARDQALRQGPSPGSVPRFVTAPEPDASAAPDRAPHATADGGPGDGGRLHFKFLESLPAAKAAADLRAAQFRAAFFEEARLTPDKQAAVEHAIKTMNDELAKVAGDLADTLQAKGKKLSTRDMADMGVKLLDVYRRGDDALGGVLDVAGLAAKEKTSFDLSTQIDIAGFAKLAETMESLGTTAMRRRR